MGLPHSFTASEALDQGVTAAAVRSHADMGLLHSFAASEALDQDVVAWFGNPTSGSIVLAPIREPIDPDDGPAHLFPGICAMAIARGGSDVIVGDALGGLYVTSGGSGRQWVEPRLVPLPEPASADRLPEPVSVDRLLAAAQSGPDAVPRHRRSRTASVDPSSTAVCCVAAQTSRWLARTLVAAG